MVFNDFAKICLDYPAEDVMDLYNRFVAAKKGKEQTFLIENCMMMLRIGRAARQAPDSVKSMLQ